MSEQVVVVPSRTRPDVEYRVLIGTDGSATCTCPGYHFRGLCYHGQHALEERGMTTQEVTDRPGTELGPVDGAVAVTLPGTVDEAVQQWAEYQQLTRDLLDESDYQRAGRDRFKKKSAWRKYAKAFNLADRVTFEHVERDERGLPLWARVRVMAQAPNGRTAEADQECHLTERCCAAAWGDDCSIGGGHRHCAAGCSGRKHWSKPGDIPATALTRAKNRAISDMIGAGEVSAEEMESPSAASSRSRSPTPPRAQRSPTASSGTPENVGVFYQWALDEYDLSRDEVLTLLELKDGHAVNALGLDKAQEELKRRIEGQRAAAEAEGPQEPLAVEAE